VRVQLGGHLRDLRLRQRGDPEALYQLVHPPRRHTEQVAGRHHRRERPLGPLATLQQPLREIRTLTQLRNRHIQRAGPSVEVAVPVPVTTVGPLRARHAVLRAAHRVGLGRQQRVDEGLQQLTQQIRTRLSQLFLQQPGRVDTRRDGHRDAPFESALEGSLEGSPDGRHYTHSDTLTGSRTPLCRTLLHQRTRSRGFVIASPPWT
jgi:hypothetical protein